MLRGYDCGCSGDRMLLKHERNYGLGMDALGTRTELWFGHGCSWNTNGIVVWASLYSARRGVGRLNPKP